MATTTGTELGAALSATCAWAPLTTTCGAGALKIQKLRHFHILY